VTARYAEIEAGFSAEAERTAKRTAAQKEKRRLQSPDKQAAINKDRRLKRQKVAADKKAKAKSSSPMYTKRQEKM
jgi:hypothetical protein